MKKREDRRSSEKKRKRNLIVQFQTTKLES